MRHEISHIDVLSVGKVAAAIYGASGALMWIFLPIFMLLPMEGAAEAVFARGFILFFFLSAPLFYAVMGFIIGIVVGAVYNLLARSFGGLEITLNPKA